MLELKLKQLNKTSGHVEIIPHFPVWLRDNLDISMIGNLNVQID